MTATAKPSRLGSHHFAVLDFHRYVAATGVCLFHVKNAQPKLDMPAAGIVATCGTAIGESARGINPRLAAVLEWFGNTSYAIYLLHLILVMAVVSPLLSSHPMSVGMLCGVLLAFVIGLTMVSHLVYTLVEAPARRWVAVTFAWSGVSPAKLGSWRPRVQD